MTPVIRWYDDAKSTLYLEIGSNWQWNDIYMLCQQAAPLRQAVSHPIGYLVYAPCTNEFPPGLSVTRMKRLLELGPNDRFLIIVGTSLFVQMMIASIMSLMGFEQRQRVHFASTLEEAEPILAAQMTQMKNGASAARGPARC